MTFGFQGFAIVCRELAEGTGCTLFDRTGLAGQATAVNIDKNVVFGPQAEGLKG